MSGLVATWLRTRLLKQRNAAWKDGLRTEGWVPLWRGSVKTSKPPTFDCIIVEPMNPQAQ